jgi:hypothetical protein
MMLKESILTKLIKPAKHVADKNFTTHLHHVTQHWYLEEIIRLHDDVICVIGTDLNTASHQAPSRRSMHRAAASLQS